MKKNNVIPFPSKKKDTYFEIEEKDLNVEEMIQCIQFYQMAFIEIHKTLDYVDDNANFLQAHVNATQHIKKILSDIVQADDIS